MDNRYAILTMKLGSGFSSPNDTIGRLVAPAGLELGRERLARDLVSLEDALAAGWEPFSVLSDRAGTEVWLRRKLTEAGLERVMDPHAIQARGWWHYSGGYRWTCSWEVAGKNWQFDLPSGASTEHEDWTKHEPHEVAEMLVESLRCQMSSTSHMVPFKDYDIVVRLAQPGGEPFGEPMRFKAGDDLEILGRALEEEP